METLYTIMAFLMVLIFLYFTYQDINILYTIYKQRKLDHSLKLALSTKGKVWFISITIIYIFAFVLGLIFVIYPGFMKGSVWWVMNGFSISALGSFLYSTQIGNLVLVGNKQMQVGRLSIDYRKMKKVDINIRKEITFVYSQKSFRFPTRWCDVTLIRKSISRRH